MPIEITGYVDKDAPPMGSQCSLNECSTKMYARTYCEMHYKRFMKHGDPTMRVWASPKLQEERFARLTVESDNGCVEWRSAAGTRKYGYFGGFGERLAHRAAWVMLYGPVPKGMYVLHTCDNPPCVNSEHLFLGTASDNAQDAVSKDRHTRGGRHHSAKLTDDAVAKLRDRWLSGESIYALSKEIGISKVSTSRAVRGKTWKHLKSHFVY